MGHHTQNITLVVQDAGNVMGRSIGIIGVGHGSIWSTVTEQHLALFLQPPKCGIIREVIPFAVGNRHLQNLSWLAAAAESRVGSLSPQIGPLTSVFQVLVVPQDPREKACLAENLKPIADPDYQPWKKIRESVTTTKQLLVIEGLDESPT